MPLKSSPFSLINVFYYYCSDNMLNNICRKPYFVTFSSTLESVPGIPSLILGPNLLRAFDHAKYLDIEFDSHRKSTNHICLLTRKPAYGLRKLIGNWPYFNVRVLISLYFSFLHSHMSYCISPCGNTYQTHMAPLQNTENLNINHLQEFFL